MHRILFVCVGNAGRSQMAEAFARSHAMEQRLDLEVKSGGTKPAKGLDPEVVAAMRERGHDLAGASPKRLDMEFARVADIIISLCGPLDAACPAPLLPKVTDWGLEDPLGKPAERVRRIRDEIEGRVVDLLHALQWADGAGETGPAAAPDTTRLVGETSPHTPPPPGLKRNGMKKSGAGPR